MNLRSMRWPLLWVALLAVATCDGERKPGTSAQDSGAADRAGNPESDAAADLGSAASPDGQGDGRPDGGDDTATTSGADGRPDSQADAGPVGAADVGPDREAAARPDVPDMATDRGVEAGTMPESDGAVDEGTSAAWPDDKYISVDEVYARVQANDPDMLLINVVDEQFYDLGFVPGSLKITYDTLESRLGELDRSRHIVVYCRKGVRSETAYDTLIANGFTLVWVMDGGIERWIAAHYPTVAE